MQEVTEDDLIAVEEYDAAGEEFQETTSSFQKKDEGVLELALNNVKAAEIAEPDADFNGYGLSAFPVYIVKVNAVTKTADWHQTYVCSLFSYCLQSIWKYLPLWSAIMREHFGYGKIRENNCTVEAHFKTIKGQILKAFNLPIQCDVFLQAFHENISGMIKMAMANLQQEQLVPDGGTSNVEAAATELHERENWGNCSENTGTRRHKPTYFDSNCSAKLAAIGEIKYFINGNKKPAPCKKDKKLWSLLIHARSIALRHVFPRPVLIPLSFGNI